MGASSSSTSRGGKNKRKMSLLSAESGQPEELSRRANRLLMQNNQQLGNTGEWHTKAHSMYELQRERSMDNNNGVEESEQEHGRGTTTTTTGMMMMPMQMPRATAAGSPKRPITSGKQRQMSGKSATAAAGPGQCSRPKLSASPVGDDCQQQIASSPSKPITTTTTTQTTISSSTSSSAKATQRKRPLTWAWLRGHDVNLPGTALATTTAAAVRHHPAEKKATSAAAAAAARRRSLRAGMESLCVTQSSSNDWIRTEGGIRRQLSANSSTANAINAHSPSTASSSNHSQLGRRASQGRPFLAQVGRQKSARKSDAGLANSLQHNPISAIGREIIQFCLEQPHNEIGVRICSRLLEKRPDFRNFVYTMGKERWMQMTCRLKEFLEMVVRRVDNIETVERISRKYGEEHVELKCFGFKPDFWVSLADAITVECVILDQAAHQPSDTITAWSLLVSIMFSAVRDGYYQAMRAQRISQRHRNVHQRETAAKMVENNNGNGIGNGHGPPTTMMMGIEKSASAAEVIKHGTTMTEKKCSGPNDAKMMMTMMVGAAENRTVGGEAGPAEEAK